MTTETIKRDDKYPVDHGYINSIATTVEKVSARYDLERIEVVRAGRVGIDGEVWWVSVEAEVKSEDDHE